MIQNKNFEDRFDVLRLVFIAVFCMLAVRISFMTIIQGEEYYNQASNKVYRKISVEAPRGEIRDKYGRLLAGSRPSFAVRISKNEVLKDKTNGVVLQLVNILEKNGDEYLDEFPIKMKNGTYKFEFDKKIKEWKESNNIPSVSSAKESFYILAERLVESGSIDADIYALEPYELQKMLNEKGVYPPIYVSKWKFSEQVRKENWLYGYGIKDENISAAKAFDKIKEYFELENMKNIDDARKIMSIRDLLKAKGYLQYQPVDVAVDVSQNTVAEIEEKGVQLTGVSVEIKPIRYYPNGSAASHILGQIGKISQTREIEYYVKEKGYSQNDMIGKTGIEKEFEERLKGTNGYNRVQVDAAGRLIKRLDMSEPLPGDSVYLTIDLDLQKRAEQSLKEVLQTIRSGGTYNSKWGNYRLRDSRSIYDKATSGAVVALDVNTGEVLALANYPDYDPNLFATGISNDDMEKLLPENRNDLLAPRPLYNIATMTAVQPGSTFKMITGLAGLEAGLSPTYTIRDNGYIKLGNKTFGCWIWNEKRGNHGNTDIYKALEVSCNYYFYSLSMGYDYSRNKPLPVKMDVDDILHYARLFGLDEKTGIQIEEFAGKVPSPEDKLKTTKRMLKNRLNKKLEKYFEDIEKNKDLNEYEKRVEKIVSWTEENPSRGEIIKRLTDLKIKSDKIGEVTDLVKYSYFSQAEWGTGDSFNISIGQGENSYTPIQMANYISSISNGGYKNKVTVVDKIESYDKLNIERIERKHEKIELVNEKNLEDIKKGMRRVTSIGTASSAFGRFPVETAAKTGTAQKSGRIPAKDEQEYIYSHLSSFGVSKEMLDKKADELEAKSAREMDREYFLRTALLKLNPRLKSADIDRFKDTYDNFAWFVSFAPYDKPEIAVVVMIFQGGHGGYGAPIARDVIAQYMGLEDEIDVPKIDYSGRLTE